VVAACGRFDFDVVGSADARVDGDASPRTTWSAPVRLAALSSGGNDWGPALRSDGITLAFASDRGSDLDLYVSTYTGTWSAPVAISSLDTPSVDLDPAWSSDGTLLYFASDRSGAQRLYQATFDGITFSAPTLVPGLSTLDALGPAISPGDLELIYTDVASASSHLAYATRASVTAPWNDQGDILELLPSADDGFPTLTPDGLTMYFETNRDGQLHIFSTTRQTLSASWSSPSVVAETTSDGDESDPSISADGHRLFFGSDRSGGSGLDDLYEATR